MQFLPVIRGSLDKTKRQTNKQTKKTVLKMKLYYLLLDKTIDIWVLWLWWQIHNSNRTLQAPGKITIIWLHLLFKVRLPHCSFPKFFWLDWSMSQFWFLPLNYVNITSFLIHVVKHFVRKLPIVFCCGFH